MISFLEGTIEFKGAKFVIVKTDGGVGYKVFLSEETMHKIPEKNEKIKLWTHLQVREDALELYGFLNFAELDLFQTLNSISGIGPKSALGVLNIAPVDTIKKAIAAGDTSYLTRVSGIGKKTAEKIVLELRDKMAGKGIGVEAPELKEEADALEALISLGYSQREAREALQALPREIASAEKRVKEALKKLGRRK
ncbi:MAG: Holliday junction branch migration protein RuvA [Candidatus Sungbacteria bacterium]|nr:Holliday junction branch migration protein RuvA [Candidatus Sungbacteria bacterium]